jgi:hypothetical protein
MARLRSKVLAKNPLPGHPGGTLSIEQWFTATERVLRAKLLVDASLAKLDARSGAEHGPKKAVPSSPLFRLPIPRMGRPLSGIRRQVLLFRAELEAEVVRVHGSVSLYRASVIGSAAIALREYLRLSTAFLGPCSAPLRAAAAS